MFGDRAFSFRDDVRPVERFPPTERVQRVLVIDPPELIAEMTTAWFSRCSQPKAGTD